MASSSPKDGSEVAEYRERKDSDPSEEPTFFEDNDKLQKRLLRKIDLRLLPILGAMYSVAQLDRVNIGAARVSGMEEDLRLDIGDRYTIAVVVFFIPYAIFELPSNIVLRKVGTASWLSFIAFAWGCTMIGQGFVTSWSTLALCRTILGFFEGGFFPGCLYLVSCWYLRYEVQRRLAWFYFISVAVAGFSGILAFGLIQMEGLSGIRGWQWIFIIEGILTVAVAILGWFLVLDFPDSAEKTGFMKYEEAVWVNRRIDIDRGDAAPDPVTWSKAWTHLKDLKLWAFAFMLMSGTMPAYALTYFAPVIIAGMGYSVGVTNLLTAPPMLAACVVGIVMASLADRFKTRGPFILGQSLVCIVGLMMTAYCEGNGPRYAGLFFGFAGCQSNLPTLLSYQANNIRTQSKRSVGSALQLGFGAIGGILGGTVFRQADAPTYVPGLWATTALQLFMLSLLGSLTLYFWRCNKKVDDGTLEKPIEGQLGFKYTL